MGEFKEAVRKKLINPPTNKNFKLSDWTKKWEATSEKSAKDQELYEAGIIFNELLSDARNCLKDLYENQYPGTKPKRLLEIYCGICNRDFQIIAAPDTWSDGGKTNFHNFSTRNNAGKNDITIDEAASANIDGLHKAIGFAYKKALKGDEIKRGAKPLGELEFSKAESYLSQLYGLYENYWQAILWGDFELKQEDGKVIDISQLKTDAEIAYKSSQKRRIKLGTQAAIKATNPEFSTRFNHLFYIEPVGSGKTRGYKINDIGNAPVEIRNKNSNYFSSFETVLNTIPENLLLAEHGESKFTIEDVIQINRLLSILGIQLLNKLPKDSECMSVGKIKEYNVKINRHRLCVALAAVTQLSAAKIDEVFEFLVFREINKQDLWGHPIVHGGGDDYYAILGAMAGAELLRVVENWLAELDIKLSDKGATYEDRVCRIVKSGIDANTLFSDHNGPISKRIKIKEGSKAVAEEEIDFILRFGQTILIGEAKSIVSTDSPISYYRTLEILSGAVAQAKRKTEFVKDNMNAVFQSLGWEKDKPSYNIVPLVFSSNKIHVGFPISGVPVVDEAILASFFRSNTIPLASIPTSAMEFEHIMWFEIYKDIATAELSIETYLAHPPQIQDSAESFELAEMRLPYIHEYSYKVKINRLMHRDVTADEYINRKHKFPLKESEGARKKLAEISFIL